jgi:hypothetical protein
MTAPITLAPIKREKPKKKQPTLTPEQRAASAERMRKNWENPEWREKIRAGAKRSTQQRMQDPEQKARLTVGLRSNEMKRLARLRTVLNEKYSDPAEREKLRQRMIALQKAGVINPKKHRITKEHWAKLVAGQKRSQDRRRGFSVPKHLWDEYSFLVNSKKLTAIQAGIMLGIIGKPVKKAA